MRTAEEMLNEKDLVFYMPSGDEVQGKLLDVIAVINEARKEAIEELCKKHYLASDDSYIIKKTSAESLINELK